MQPLKKGFLHGLPIGLGYFSVSIGFGLLAVTGGLTIAQAVMVSLTNVTSAGQLAGVQVMFAGGSLVEMAMTQLVINMRYALMSVALSQKLDEKIGMSARLGIAFFNTDEIFAVAASQPERLSRPYMAGLAVLPYIGWALGTLVGAAMGSVFPEPVRNGMGVLIYAMFIAIILPPSKKSASIRTAVVLSAAISCALRFLPGLSISGGFSVIISALCASVFCALRNPIVEVES